MDRDFSIECPKCKTWLGSLVTPRESPLRLNCPFCRAVITADVFPAFYRKNLGDKPAGEAAQEGESSCFYHPQKRAAVACDGCGRFLCSLCEVELSGLRLCPSCIEAGVRRKKFKNLENRRVLYDDIALSLAILPILIFYMTIFTAPAALYYCIRYWNAPSSFIPRTRIRFVLAAIIALLQIGGWTALGIALWAQWRHFG